MGKDREVRLETMGNNQEQSREMCKKTENIQGGSDKSGIVKVFFKNHTAQLKIIRFY